MEGYSCICGTLRDNQEGMVLVIRVQPCAVVNPDASEATHHSKKLPHNGIERGRGLGANTFP